VSGPGVLLVTPEPITERMAGPAIRMLELGHALAADGRSGPVTVASLGAVGRSDDRVAVVPVETDHQLRDLVARHGSVVIQGDVLGLHPWLIRTDVPLVADAYDPFHLEQLEQARALGEVQRRIVVRDCVRALNTQLTRADLVLCASPRQRALWAGHLAALGRINPLVYDDAPDLSALLRVVPFGTPDRAPAARDRSVLHGAIPGLTDNEIVLVWGGGLYDWFDPELLLRAVGRLADEGAPVRLLFLGVRHPVPGVRTAGSAVRERARAEGLLDRVAHFHDGWVPYDERDLWLRAADIGVSTHHDHVETEFSFRTRITDYLWCGLPVVCTAGDDLADRVRETGAGHTVPAGDLDALVEALRLAIGHADWRARAGQAARRAGTELAWTTGVRPLADFCAAPRRAPDLRLDVVDRAQLGIWEPAAGRMLTRIRAARREGGLGLVARRLAQRLGRPAGDRPPGPVT
jgi:glycosyltransferase involved in cell wall biosynthesis